MEQRALKNGLNTNNNSYIKATGGQSSNLYLNVVHFVNTIVNYTSVVAQDGAADTRISGYSYKRILV